MRSRSLSPENFGTSDDSESAEINLTPMLDVVFIMLIFFIVTASFVKESAVDVAAPPPVSTMPANPDAIAILVFESGRITVNGLVVDPRAVSAHITTIRGLNPEARLSVMAAKRSNAEMVVGVIDAARDAGFRSVPVSEMPE